MMYLHSRKYLFSKGYARRIIARTLFMSVLVSSSVLLCARYLMLRMPEKSVQAPVDTACEAASMHHVALTFDDSPSKYTLQIVEILNSMGVKAAFFITGVNVPGREDAVVSIYRSGHDLGNHTWDYTGIGIKSAYEAVEDVAATEDLVKDICGRATPFVRPPYQSISGEAYAALYGAGYRIINYDIDAGDFFNSSKQSILGSISSAKAGNILRFHDGKISPETLRSVIDSLREMGLEPVALSTLLSEMQE